MMKLSRSFHEVKLNRDPRVALSIDSLLTSNLVSHSLGLNDGDVINDSLVEVEILGQSNFSVKGLISQMTYFP